MASLYQGYKVWDSNDGFNCTCSVVQTIKGVNPRPAQLQPSFDTNTGQIVWTLVDNITSAAYPDVNGAKAISGIAVDDPDALGLITFWDVSGTGAAGVAILPTTDTPADKLTQFSYVLNNQCLDCTGTITQIPGQYQCTYPAAITGGYCYTFTQTDGADPMAKRALVAQFGEYLLKDIENYGFVQATGVSTYKVSLSAPIAVIGYHTADINVASPGENEKTYAYAQTNWTVVSC